MFGPDIYDLMAERTAAYEQGQEVGDNFYRGLSDYDSLRLAAYKGWQDELKDRDYYTGFYPAEDEQEAALRRPAFERAQQQSQVPDWRTYEGSRPYGSDMQPIGEGDPTIPLPWVRGMLNGAQPGGPPPQPGFTPLPGGQPQQQQGPPQQPQFTPLPGNQQGQAAGRSPWQAPTIGGDTSGWPSMAGMAAGPQTTQGVADDGRTLEDYANMNEKYVAGKAKYAAGRAKWLESQADFAAKRAEVGSTWGDESLTHWDEFFALPKGSDARKAYKDANPIVKAMLLTAYNPAEYQAAVEAGFTTDDILGWAGKPAYEGDGAERAAYWDANPGAWEFNAYLNGRPKPIDPTEDSDEAFVYDWGQDYAAAKELFGDNIWSVVMMQKSLPDDKVAKAQWYEAHPEYQAWADWWYANLPDTGVARAAYTPYAARPYYGGGGGGGGRGNGYGTQGGGDPARIGPIQGINRELWNTSGRQQRQWLPYSEPNPDWLRSGQQLGPERRSPWQPPRFNR
jgi:hypothetical protein